MNALTYRLRRRFRREWQSTLIFAVIVAVVGTSVLAIAAGATRTSSVPDRYTELPPVVENLARVQSVPYLPALVLAVLGAYRRWVKRVVHWQATAFALLPLVFGVPAGFLVGQMTLTQLLQPE